MPDLEEGKISYRQLADTLALGCRLYHLPSNKRWCEDWRQFMANNHPLFGLCCFDKRTPLGWGQRIMATLVSILVGYSFTVITLWLSVTFIPSLDESMFGVSTDGEAVHFTRSQISLWTWIACIHAFYDVAIWRLFDVSYSPLWLMFWVGIALTFTGVMVGENVSNTSSNNEFYSVGDVTWYTAVEIVLSWVVWYVLVGTILFSGVLGCGRLPILGGRPRELYLQKKMGKIQIPRRTIKTLASLKVFEGTDDDDDEIVSKATKKKPKEVPRTIVAPSPPTKKEQSRGTFRDNASKPAGKAFKPADNELKPADNDLKPAESRPATIQRSTSVTADSDDDDDDDFTRLNNR